MAGNIKGITVDIGGNTTGLDKALKDVNKTINSTTSELKQVDKGLKLDPNNVVLLAQKSELLSKSIVETSEKLKSLESVEKQVETQFKSGEIDGGQYRAFQRELQDTKSKLSSLKDEKKSVSSIGASFDGVSEKVESAVSKIKNVASALKTATVNATEFSAKAGKAGFDVVATGVSGAEKALKAYGTALTATATATGGLALSAGGAADDINTMALQTGLSTEEIQKFQYASNLIDVDMSTLTGSMAKLTKNMNGAKDGTGTASDAFKKLGVSITDSNGELRNNQDVFDDAITALGGISNETERDALAMSIFGKSAQDLNPLILGGADLLEYFGGKAEKAGMILSHDALNNLNKFNDSVDILKSNASASGKIIAGPFASSFKKFTDIVGNSLPTLATDLAGIFSGENMEENSANFGEHLTDLLTNIVNGVAEQLPTYIQEFNSVILGVVNAVIANLPTIINSILPTLITGLTSLTQGIVSTSPTLIPLLATGAVQLFTGLLDGLNKVVEQLMPMLPKIVQQITDILIENLPTIIEGGFQLLTGLISGLAQCTPKLIDTVVALIPIITQSLLDNLPALVSAGIDLVVALAEGLPQAIPQLILAIPEIIKAIITAFGDVDWSDVGSNILEGIAGGLVEGVKAIGDVISDVAGDIYDGFCDFFGIHSPSRLFRDNVGLNLARGIGIGFEDEMDDVNAQMQNVLPTSFDTSVAVNANGQMSTAKSMSDLTAKMPENAVFNIIINGKTVAETLAPYLDVINGANINLAERGLPT